MPCMSTQRCLVLTAPIPMTPTPPPVQANPDLNDLIGYISNWNAVVVGMFLLGIGTLIGLATVSRHGRLCEGVGAMRAAANSCEERITTHIFVNPEQQERIDIFMRAKVSCVEWLDMRLNPTLGSQLVVRPVLGMPLRCWYYAWTKLVLEDRLKDAICMCDQAFAQPDRSSRATSALGRATTLGLQYHFTFNSGSPLLYAPTITANTSGFLSSEGIIRLLAALRGSRPLRSRFRRTGS
ncbi:hypothetical protein EXIGLDRAFT_332192 [Exidia glandulosa HHB12029]|uniref:Uncharacterized protein n=1 Tax=Exidia glandulosa HHB12029 TaxID=1314781 RepID=A0A165CQD7_EXIGL|nr:hypothetical protein EXIGLDRAFT_332192 [Exidia glandulosa HHB12029]